MLVVDTHLHVYPAYDTARFLSAFRRNALSAVPQDTDATAAMVLVEREGSDVFGAWRAGERLPHGVVAEPLDDDALRLRFPDEERVVVLAGRQVACRERIEILGLGCRAGIPDGTPAEDAVKAVLAAQGVPVLAWGVGKWWFRRAAVVNRLLERFGPNRLLMGDTSLRPVFWPEPAPMRRAVRAGRRILAGSDTLPAAGEEAMAGRYVTVLETRCPPSGTVAAWIRRALADPAVPLHRAGRRSSPGEFRRRMRKG